MDINQYLLDIISELKYDNPGVTIKTNIPDYKVYCSIDPVQLQRVISNLIGNSIKYAGSNPIISVDVKRQGGIKVTIADNGPGIDKESISNIFKKFYRADPARSSSTEGSGLGLAIAKEIIIAHNGFISAYSPPEGGLSITFTIPEARRSYEKYLNS
jgi:histidine kinase